MGPFGGRSIRNSSRATRSSSISRFPDRAADVVGAVPYAVRPAPSGRGRKPGPPPPSIPPAFSVVGMRYAAVIICGVLCGLAGAYLATALNAGFVKDMSAGRGYIALAALIFAKWRPWYALMACLPLRLLRRGRQPVPEHHGGRDRRAGAVHGRRCPTSSWSSCLRGSWAGPFRRAQEGSLMSRNAEELAAADPRPGGEHGAQGRPRAGLGAGASGRGGGRRRHRLHRPAGFPQCGRLGPQPETRDRRPGGHPRRPSSAVARITTKAAGVTRCACRSRC